MPIEGPHEPEVRVEKFPSFGTQEASRNYHFSKDVMPQGLESVQYWIDKDNQVYLDSNGEGPDKLGETWKSFTQELLTIGVTGFYADNKVFNVFINKAGNEIEPKWGEVEPKIMSAIQEHLYK